MPQLTDSDFDSGGYTVQIDPVMAAADCYAPQAVDSLRNCAAWHSGFDAGMRSARYAMRNYSLRGLSESYRLGFDEGFAAWEGTH